MDTRDQAESDADQEFEHGELLAYLVETFSAGLDPRQLRQRGDAAQRELALHALPLLETLRPGEIKVQVTNPGGDWAGRTVLELLIADQPFLVDTLQMTLRRLSLRVLQLLHPLLAIERRPDGAIDRFGKSAPAGERESYVYAEVPLIEDADRRAAVEVELREVFTQLRNVVADHGCMVKALRKHMAELESSAAQIQGGAERTQELTSFLDWLAEDNFVFLGYRYDRASRVRGTWHIELDESSVLGILRDTERSRFREPQRGKQIPAIIRSRLADERLVFFDKSRAESTIHRRGRLDLVSVKVLDDKGHVAGFGKFMGLLTHKAIRTRGSEIPLLSKRHARVLEAVGAEPGSHTYKTAVEAYDSLPVEFLFPFDLGDVTRAVQRIIRAMETPQVEVHVVPDPLNRSFFVSVILPRPLYDENLRRDLLEMLRERYGVSYADDRTSFLDDEIALIHFFCSSGEDVDIDQLGELEREIKERATGWEARFELALLDHYPDPQGYQLVEEYGLAFPEEYRVVTTPSEAVLDVEGLQRLLETESRVEVGLYTDAEPGDTIESRIKIYQRERPYLTDLLPVLKNFGLRVFDATLTEVSSGSSRPLWIVTFRMDSLSADAPSCDDIETRILEGLRAALCGRVASDSLNRLVQGASLAWYEVEVLRAYLAYSQQLGIAPTHRFASQALLDYPTATHALLTLFRARFDPDLGGDRASAEELALLELTRERERIPTADSDRIFELFANLIHSTARTNFFATPPESADPLAFKIISRQVAGMPSPKPGAEVFVHCAEMNAIHLRGGRVARGGIRWSDRLQDLRTEVLGLMKTQTAKNALIVPAGAKGGFVLKRRFADPGAVREEADRQYARFMRTLLGITDNIVEDRVVPPDRVVRHDGDDPYLVVAADKGTAHLSDVANQVAREAEFWLDDAYASGGSDGFDHKREGITARGAWLCVKRHFLELGKDIDKETYSMIGIGDMSGDVFGNGLLLARKTRLRAAFNHVHIFLDPDPDSEVGWIERKRLFELPGSSWRDYDPKKLSKGGGVFDRAARSIRLTPQVREMLGVQNKVLSGDDLIRAILSMQADLLWNGGIGTYVKATSESDADVGDRTNASVRINADELRARVVGEGGNLGLTQLARVEYALAGGRINTDAIDNSAGVDLSDHEVNFKILLAQCCKDGRMTRKQRNAALRACVEEADATVLAHNAGQARCLSMDLLRSRQDPDRMILAAEFLEEQADLDPTLEFLPGRDELHSRTSLPGAPVGYSRPELAILLAYTKLLTKRELAASEVPDHSSLLEVLRGYVPESLRSVTAGEIERHRLRREITATCLTNRVIDRAGVTLVPELVRAAGVSVAEVLLAWFIVDQLLEADRLRVTLQEQDMSEALRLQAAVRIEEAVRVGAGSYLALERGRWLELDEITAWARQMRALRKLMLEDVGETSDESHPEGQLEPGLAREIDQLPLVARGLCAVSLSMRSKTPLPRVVQLHADIGASTRITWLLNRLRDMDRGDDWDRIAAEALQIEMLESHGALTQRLLADGDGPEGLENFRAARAPALQQIERTVQQLEARERGGLAPLTVLSQQIRRLC